MIIARMESLIAGWGEEEALMRAQKSIEAGADAIMIHSKEKSPDEVLSFLNEYTSCRLEMMRNGLISEKDPSAVLKELEDFKTKINGHEMSKFILRLPTRSAET